MAQLMGLSNRYCPLLAGESPFWNVPSEEQLSQGVDHSIAINKKEEGDLLIDLNDLIKSAVLCEQCPKLIIVQVWPDELLN